MEKTTLYLPAELKRAIRRIAAARACSEAEVIRDAIARVTGAEDSPAPMLPLFKARGPSIAHRIDEVLGEGFGRR